MHPTQNRRWVALLLLTAVEFILLLDTSIVNVALPTIKAALHFSEADLAWIPNVYQLVFGGFLLLGGRAADLFGRRRLFLAGLALFTVGSLLAGLAPTAALLLIARAAQGVGAALVIPAEQSLLVTIFTDPAEFNRAIGIWGALGAAGGATGLALGGILTQFAGWPWIFLINVPIGVVVLLLAPSLLPESRAEGGAAHRLDIAGAIAVTLALLLLAYTLVEAPQAHWSLFQVSGALLLTILLLAAFVGIEARAVAPLVPLRVFTIRNLNGANLVSLLVGAAHAPLFFFLSLYLQQVLGYSPLDTGVALLPIALASIATAALLLSRALNHVGAKAVLVGGMSLLAVGIALFARVPLHADYLRDILPASLIVAIGLPAAFAGSNIPAVTAVAESETGLASGMVNTLQRFGSGLGIAGLAILASAVVGAGGQGAAPSALAPGLRVAFLGAAALALLGAVLALALIQQPKQARGGARSDKELAPAGTHPHFHH